MDNQQAKFILQAYRPGGQDADDPLFQEALEQARRDPELARWFAEEQAFDAAVGGKIKSIPIPAELKADILAGQRIIRPQPWWKKSSLLATAASIALLLVAAAFWKSALDDSKHYQQEMTGILSTMQRLDFRSNKIEEIKKWLASSPNHRALTLASNFEKLPVEGCSVLNWHGKDVTLICFQTATNNFKAEMHLLAIDYRDLRKPPGPGEIKYSQLGGWSMASWTDGVHVYILAGKVKQDYLEAYVPQAYCH